MTKFSKNIVLATLIIGILAGGFWQPLSPKVAQAQVGAVPTVNTLDFPRLAEWSLSEALNVALHALKKRILDMMVDQVINWINGGGKPQFVSDWQGLVEDAANQAAGDFVKELGAGFLCRPFSLKLQIALLPVRKFNQRADCTLDDIVRNIDNFYNDFLTGGWIGYSRAWEPQNNFLGIYLMSADERITRMSDAANAAVNEAISGGGFLSTKKCQKDAQGRDIPSTCVVTTPGKTIGDTLSKAVGSDIDFIVNANELSEYIGAIADAAINRMVVSGVNGILGAKAPSAPATGGIVTPTPGNCAGLSGTTLQTCQNYTGAYGRNFSFSQEGFINQISLTLTPRKAGQQAIGSSITTLNSYLSSARTIRSTLANLTVFVCREDGPEQFLRTDLVNQIQASIDTEQAILSGLRQEQTNNQSDIDSLENAKTQIGQLPTNDWNSLLPIFKTVEGNLDSTEANDFKSAKEAETGQISQRTATQLADFNKKLKICQDTQR